MGGNPITFGQLVNLCLKSPGFFHKLQDNPAQAISDAGFEATPLVVESLKNFDYSAVRKVYHACDPAVAPIC